MAVTNLFKVLSKPTGEFYMFSNYADDLTRQMTQPKTYRVVPSKFAALELNRPEECENLALLIGTAFQNYFENSSTFLRELDYSTLQPNNTPTEYKKWWSSRMVWATLLKYGFITKDTTEPDEEEEPIDYFPELHYIGDINIYSTTETDGTAYNEIYCYIPNDAKDTRYNVYNIALAERTKVEYPDEYLMGWNATNYPQNTEIPNVPEFDEENKISIYDADTWFRPDALYCEVTEGIKEANDVSTSLAPTTDATKFDINSILVFYDIISIDEDGTETVKYKNLPLGIYFTGYSEGELSNVIEKYVSSEDIYDQGTSYGLRICNRYVSTPNATVFLDTNIDAFDGMADFSHAMQLMGENAELMNLIAQQNETTYKNLDEHLAQFKNYRTNVPYIRQLMIDGAMHGVWFVNGRNTGQIAGVYVNRETQVDWDCEDPESPAYIANKDIRSVVTQDRNGDQTTAFGKTDTREMVFEAGDNVDIQYTASEDDEENPQGIITISADNTQRTVFVDGTKVLDETESKPINLAGSDNVMLQVSDEPEFKTVTIRSRGGGSGASDKLEYEPESHHTFFGNSSVLFDNMDSPEMRYTVEFGDGVESGKRYRIGFTTYNAQTTQQTDHFTIFFENFNMPVFDTPKIIVEDTGYEYIEDDRTRVNAVFHRGRNTLELDFRGIVFKRANPVDIVYINVTFLKDRKPLKYILIDYGYGKRTGDFIIS